MYESDETIFFLLYFTRHKKTQFSHFRLLPEAITVRRYQHENPTSGQLLRNDTRLDLSIEPDFYRGASLNSHCPTSKTFFNP